MALDLFAAEAAPGVAPNGGCRLCHGAVLPGRKMCDACCARFREYHRRRVETGVCTACARPAVPGKVFCEECAATRREQGRTKYADRAASGRCTKCGAESVPGRTLCAPCRAEHRKRNQAKPALGICVQCVRPVVRGTTLCEEHARYHAEKSKRRYQRAVADGECCRCSGGRAEVGRYCRPCWFKTIANATLKNIHMADAIAALFDAQGGRCAYTREPLVLGVTASIDHIVPRSRGGTHDIGNLQWVARTVNHAKNNLSEAEFVTMCRAVARAADGGASEPVTASPAPVVVQVVVSAPRRRTVRVKVPDDRQVRLFG